jgi:opacity protein-like surface antigen
MKNTTLAMVAVLAAVVMLSAVLAAVPMQQANAWDRDGKDGKDGKDTRDGKDSRDGKDGKDGDGDNKVIIKQSNECEEVEDESCVNNLPDGMITQNSGEDDFPPGPP